MGYQNQVRQFQKSSKMAENSCYDLQMERFRLVLHSFSEGGWQPRSNYHFQLINNLFSAKFCRTFEITSSKKSSLSFFLQGSSLIGELSFFMLTIIKKKGYSGDISEKQFFLFKKG